MLFEHDSKRAVAYYRHSREHAQENSVEIQREFIHRFAGDNSIEIIHEEEDDGVTGLIEERPGFQRLYREWIENSNAPEFEYVIVFDASRFSRFQNQDLNGHLRYVCQQHGKRLICANRGLPKEGDDLLSYLVLTIDGFQAADYSRQLSLKVSLGAKKVIEQGYSACGQAPFGLARMLLDEERRPIGVLRRGQHKTISNQRVTFVPAEDGSETTVKQIFEWFVNGLLDCSEIVGRLNNNDFSHPRLCRWSRARLMRILRNPMYTGTLVYNKTTQKLKTKRRPNPKEQWIIRTHAFQAIVGDELFERAQRRLEELYDDQKRVALRQIQIAKHQYISEFARLFRAHGIASDAAALLAQRLPLLFSLGRDVTDNDQWCFCVPNALTDQRFVLGIGLSDVIRSNDAKKRRADQMFLLPTTEFRRGKYRIVRTSDEAIRLSTSEAADFISKLKQLANPS